MSDPNPLNDDQSRPPSIVHCSPLVSLLRSVDPRYRPMPFLLFGLTAGILAGHSEIICTAPCPSLLPFAVILAAALAAAVRFPRSAIMPRTMACLLLFAILGLTTFHLHTPQLPHPPSMGPFYDRPETLYVAEVMLPPDVRRESVRVSLRLHAALEGSQLVPLEGGVLVTLPPESIENLLLHGEIVLARLTLRRLHNFNNPGGYDFVREMALKGLHARAHVSDGRWVVRLESTDLQPSNGGVRSLRKTLNRVRHATLDFVLKNAVDDTGALYAALLLGYRNLISQDLREAIAATGVAHLLAISGLHLGLVAMASFWVGCRFLRIFFPSVLARFADSHLALWAALGATTFYALLSGLAVPTWRALVAVSLLFLGMLWYRRASFATTLSTAAIFILALAPHSLWQPSFQLSFAAVTGIVCVAQAFSPLATHLESRFSFAARPSCRFLKPFWTAFWVSLAANVAVLPILAYHFHGISLMGFLVNTLLVPLVGMAALPIGLAACAVQPFSNLLGGVILQLGSGLLKVAEEIILFCAQWSWSYHYVGTISPASVAIYYAALILMLLPCSAVRRILALCVLASVCILCTSLHHARDSSSPPLRLKATFLDVGQGTSTLLEFPSGETMLVDGGGFWDHSFDVGRHVVAPFIWHRGIRHLDYVVLSHDHPDHKNGLKFILSTFSIGQFWESGIHAGSRSVGDLEAIAHRRGIPVKKLESILGSHRIGGAEVRVLHPSEDYLRRIWDRRNLNNISLVLQIRFGSTSVLLPGDIDQSVETTLPLERDENEQWLVAAPHHGSASSSGMEWLRSLQPAALIFSCGKDNVFGFPAPEVLERKRALRIPHYRTDRSGAVEAVSDGLKWSFKETVQSMGMDWQEGASARTGEYRASGSPRTFPCNWPIHRLFLPECP